MQGKAGCCIRRLLVWWSSGLDVSPQDLQSLGAGQPGSSSSRCRAWAEPGAFYLCLLGPEASRGLYSAHRGSCSHSALTPGPEAVTALHEDRCQMQNPEKIKVQESVKNHPMPGVPLTCLGYYLLCHASLRPCPLWTGLGKCLHHPPGLVVSATGRNATPAHIHSEESPLVVYSPSWSSCGPPRPPPPTVSLH